MPSSELLNLLKKLKLEINNIKSVDKSSVEMLDKMKREIDRALERSEAKQEVEHFEASHSELTAKMNNVINFLNNVGL